MKKNVVEHHLVEFVHPQKISKTCRDHIVFHLTEKGELLSDERHADGAVFDLKLKERERAIIMSVRVKWCTNDTERDIVMEFQDVFALENPKETGHPDVTGKIRFILSRNANGTVPKRDQLLYEPNFTNLGFPIIQYIGMEHSIMNARSTAVIPYDAVVDFEIFKRSDHLVVFLLENKQLFKEIKTQDIVSLNDGEHYKISKTAVRRVRSFFYDSIFSQFHYVTTNHLKLAWAAEITPPPQDPPPHLRTKEELATAKRKNDGFAIIVLYLKMEYIVVKPETYTVLTTIKGLNI